MHISFADKDLYIWQIILLKNVPMNQDENQFGGNWTKTKIEILVEYAQAYLKIMEKRPYWKLMYFDGFAGSGSIINDKSEFTDITIGAAKRIIEINHPRPFDTYYFVEKTPKYHAALLESTKNLYKNKDIHCALEDCNVKLKALANFLKKPENVAKYKILAYIDPCGMQLEWESLQSLKGLDIDAWILVPTGLGVNRLLVNNGNIDPEWMSRLEKFLGLDKEKIFNHFYTQQKITDLFGDTQTLTHKNTEAIEKSAILYQSRLAEIFKNVSNPYKLLNSTNSIMYHLFFASNNTTGKKIANDIVKKYTNKRL